MLDRLAALGFDETFRRMWEFYLALCEAGFRTRSSMVFQMQLARRNNVLPLTRDYMAEAERPAALRTVVSDAAAD